jgi:hypothetical protein
MPLGRHGEKCDQSRFALQHPSPGRAAHRFQESYFGEKIDLPWKVRSTLLRRIEVLSPTVAAATGVWRSFDSPAPFDTGTFQLLQKYLNRSVIIEVDQP